MLSNPPDISTLPPSVPFSISVPLVEMTPSVALDLSFWAADLLRL